MSVVDVTDRRPQRLAGVLCGMTLLCPTSVIHAASHVTDVRKDTYSLTTASPPPLPSLRLASTKNSLSLPTAFPLPLPSLRLGLLRRETTAAQPRSSSDEGLPVSAATPPIDASRWFVEHPLTELAPVQATQLVGSAEPAPSGPSAFSLGLFGMGLVGLWHAWSAAARR